MWKQRAKVYLAICKYFFDLEYENKINEKNISSFYCFIIENVTSKIYDYHAHAIIEPNDLELRKMNIKDKNIISFIMSFPTGKEIIIQEHSEYCLMQFINYFHDLFVKYEKLRGFVNKREIVDKLMIPLADSKSRNNSIHSQHIENLLSKERDIYKIINSNDQLLLKEYVDTLKEIKYKK